MKSKTIQRLLNLAKFWPINKIAVIYIRSKLKKTFGGENMKKIKAFLEGKKTYVIIGIGVITALIEYFTDIHIPEQVWIGIFSAIGITVKAGWNRTEKATKDLLEAVRDSKKGK